MSWLVHFQILTQVTKIFASLSGAVWQVQAFAFELAFAFKLGVRTYYFVLMIINTNKWVIGVLSFATKNVLLCLPPRIQVLNHHHCDNLDDLIRLNNFGELLILNVSRQKLNILLNVIQSVAFVSNLLFESRNVPKGVKDPHLPLSFVFLNLLYLPFADLARKLLTFAF